MAEDYAQEKIKPYGKQGEKGVLVEQMFDNIAPSYDKLNHRLSWNIDRKWRNTAIDQLVSLSPKTILDVATGTGDFAILSAMKLQPQSLVGIDISDGMMDIGRRKVKERGLEGVVSFKKEDCLNLSFSENTFDAITVAFGIRNFQDLDRGLQNMYRVLKQGGKVVIVELTTPVKFPMKQLYAVYRKTVLPLYGRLISKDTDAYNYLNKTIAAFPQGEKMQEILQKAGFCNVKFKRLTFGICTLYTAEKK
jgi:demethylmenaquinone methyltransferase / 2-methoxy-6-polyprenyl-1,4-benzoquinol methylase